MFKKILEFFFGKTTVEDDYPFSDKIRTFLPIAASVDVALTFMHNLCDNLDITTTEAEVLFFILGNGEPVTVFMVQDEITHVCEAHVSRIIRKLTRRGYLTKIISPSCDDRYVLSSVTMTAMKEVL